MSSSGGKSSVVAARALLAVGVIWLGRRHAVSTGFKTAFLLMNTSELPPHPLEPCLPSKMKMQDSTAPQVQAGRGGPRRAAVRANSTLPGPDEKGRMGDPTTSRQTPVCGVWRVHERMCPARLLSRPGLPSSPSSPRAPAVEHLSPDHGLCTCRHLE